MNANDTAAGWPKYEPEPYAVAPPRTSLTMFLPSVDRIDTDSNGRVDELFA